VFVPSTDVHEVVINPLALDHLARVLTPERAGAVELGAARARERFGDRSIWHVNATAQGGGVAEMLQTLLAYAAGAQIDTHWLVLDGDSEFFALTKRIHNMLHGDPGDGGPLGDGEHAHYQGVLDTDLEWMLPRVSPRDIVVLHDPQTAGLLAGLRSTGVRVVWRCHVGRDTPNELTEAAWAFLRPYIEPADAYVFTRRVYAPRWLDGDRLVVIPPSIDPFSAKNRELDPDAVRTVLTTAGLVSGAEPGDPVAFRRRDGTEAIVRHRTGLLDGPPPPFDARLVIQVSRWDRLKDMSGVMAGFARLSPEERADAHLMLVGPDVSGVTDDPEGAEVLAECRAAWGDLPDDVRGRVHLASIPMDDVNENAIIVNALQRHAYAVVQKSLVEGFGLTVTEAMWKGRPVIGSLVGGIQDQITDGHNGLLIPDPTDIDAFTAILARLLQAPQLAARLGEAAHLRVREQFLGDRHLGQFVSLYSRLLSPEGFRRDS
jgi:trehalose synthase